MGRYCLGGIASNAEIQKILAERVDTYRQSVGVVVGVIEPSGRRIVTYGRTSANATTPLNGDTLFEIGSMTKVFTSLLLAEAVQRGEVALTDPISKYLPASVKVPESGRAITLQDLSQHSSGLPREIVTPAVVRAVLGPQCHKFFYHSSRRFLLSNQTQPRQFQKGRCE